MSKRKLELKTKKKILISVTTAVLLLFLIIVLLFRGCDGFLETKPTLTIETPQKISLSESDEVTLDVTISSFGEALYPAASMSIAFDTSRLEFIGIEEGNVFVRNNASETDGKLPEWSCNPTQCNKSGKINIMYLDTTGGRNAFDKALLEKDDNVVIRLKFRLRGSARAGDVYDLVFEDAVFAASDETQSLAMTTQTLRVKNGKLVIGE